MIIDEVTSSPSPAQEIILSIYKKS